MPSPLLMIPGPTPVASRVLAALAEPARSHTGPDNAATMRRIQSGRRQLVGSEAARVHAFAGAGTLAMEAALANHATRSERVVVVSHGYFSDRFIEVAEAFEMKAGSELGFTPVTRANRLAPTLSVLAVPPGVDEAARRAGVAGRGVIAAGCLGPWAGGASASATWAPWATPRWPGPWRRPPRCSIAEAPWAPAGCSRRSACSC